MEQQEEVRVAWGTGIAGHVAESGEPVNIPDAYQVSSLAKPNGKFSGEKTNPTPTYPPCHCAASIDLTNLNAISSLWPLIKLTELETLANSRLARFMVQTVLELHMPHVR